MSKILQFECGARQPKEGFLTEEQIKNIEKSDKIFCVWHSERVVESPFKSGHRVNCLRCPLDHEKQRCFPEDAERDEILKNSKNSTPSMWDWVIECQTEIINIEER